MTGAARPLPSRGPACLSRRGLALAAPLLANVLPGCAGAILARGLDVGGGRLTAREVAVLDAHEPPRPGLIGALAWSPDGSRIAVAGFGEGSNARSTDVMLWDVAARRRVAAVPRASRSRFAFAFTPDSRLLVMPAAHPPGAPVAPLPGPDHLSLVDALTGAIVGEVPSGLPPPPGGPPLDVALAPTGCRAAAMFPGGPRGVVAVVYDAPAGGSWRPAASFALPWLDAHGVVAFSPEGERLALAGGLSSHPGSAFTRVHHAVQARDLRAGGGPTWSADLGERGAQSLAWGGPGGNLVVVGLSGNAAAGTVGERVIALDARTGARRWAASWPAATVEDLAFSPDGRLLAAASRGDEVRVLDAVTGETLLAIGGLRQPRIVAWGPAGPGPLLLAFNDGPRVRIAAIGRVP